MPEQRGRRRRRAKSQVAGRRSQESAAEPSPAPDGQTPREGAAKPRSAMPARPVPPSGVPSPTARVSGFVIALVTAFLGGLLIEQAISGMSGAAAVGQIIGGLLLIALVVFVGVLVLFPAQVRDVIARRRERRRR